jgi:hypothetical protein
MSKGTLNVFVGFVNFISKNWKLKHVTIELFESFVIIIVAMVLQL